jgi:hypothetical protein
LVGIAQTSENRGHVMIVLNDTLKKKQGKIILTLIKKKCGRIKLNMFSDENGKFSIRADLKDSLFFSRDRYISQTHNIQTVFK